MQQLLIADAVLAAPGTLLGHQLVDALDGLGPEFLCPAVGADLDICDVVPDLSVFICLDLQLVAPCLGLAKCFLRWSAPPLGPDFPW